MKIKTILLSAASILLFASCYKDEGNYDYTVAPTVDFSKVRTGLEFVVTEPYSYTAELSFESPATEADFEFWWELDRVDGDPVPEATTLCEGLTFEFTPWSLGQHNFSLVARHKATGVTSQTAFYGTSSSPYGKVWIVLSEVDSRSSYTVVRPLYDLTVEPKKRIYRLYKDIYHQAYGHESPLGTGPRRVFGSYNNSGTSMMVLQADRSVSLDGATLTKTMPLEQEFFGQQYPPGCDPVDYLYTAYTDALLSSDGLIYTRGYNFTSGTSTLFHVTLFSSIPVEYNGDKIRTDRIFKMNNNVGYFAVHDMENDRLLWISCMAYITQSVAYQAKNPSPVAGEVNINDLNGYEILFGGGVDHVVSPPTVFFVFQKDGHMVAQNFNITQNLMGAPSISGTKVRDVSDKMKLTAESAVYLSRFRNRFYYSSGTEIYLYDIATGNNIPLYSFPEGTIVAMNVNPQESELGVAFEEGRLVLLDIGTNLDDVQPMKGGEFTGLGKIVDMMYKYSDYMGWVFPGNTYHYD